MNQSDIEHNTKYYGMSRESLEMGLKNTQAIYTNPYTPSPAEVVKWGQETLDYLNLFDNTSVWFDSIVEYRKEITYGHFVSLSCEGENCSMCGQPATHKVGEEILPDDPMPVRHNLTAYVCCTHFKSIVGSAAPCRER